MPLGAAHAARVEDMMRSERSKGSGENLYSTGFAAPASCRPVPRACLSLPKGRLSSALADDVNSHTHFELLPTLFCRIYRDLERDPKRKARAVPQGQPKMPGLNHKIAGNPGLFVVK